MPVEKSAGVVIFRKEKGKNFYLVLHYPSDTRTPGKDYWDFPKGHIEEKERPDEAAKREVKEETGLTDIKFIEGFKSWIKYFFKKDSKDVFKIVTFYLAETKTKEVKISQEHIGYQWLLYEQALEQITFENAKEILKKANNYLKSLSALSADRP